MATGTLRVNQKYVPWSIFSKDAIKKKTYGWIDYRMHKEGNICCSVWKDQNAVVLPSTHAEALPSTEKSLFVYKKINGKRKKVRTGPMHLQYTQNMTGIDTADQIQGQYSYLTRSHKQWYRIFFYFLDTTISNAWIVHNDLTFRFCEEPLSHMFFQMCLAKELLAKWTSKTYGSSKFSPSVPAPHGPKSMGTKRGNYIVCGTRTNSACPGCSRHICRGSCYWSSHN